MGEARRARRGVLAGLAAIAGAASLGLAGAGAPSAAAQAAEALGGPVIIGGDDLTDHGFYDGEVGENREGWLYIEKALLNLAPNVTRPNDGTVAALGSSPSEDDFGGDAGAAIGRAAEKAGMNVTYWDGEEGIQAFFAALDAGEARPMIIWISGDGAFNDLGDSPDEGFEPQALIDNATKIGDFVNTGGGLMSHGSEFGWLFGLLPGLHAIDDGSGNDLYLTPAGEAAFPGLTNADVNAGPWHNYFEGDFGGLQVLVRSSNIQDSQTGEDAAVILGGAAVILPGSISLDPREATNPPGTSHTVVATVRDDQGGAREEVFVDFGVIDGPNVGAGARGLTDANGQASFTYVSNGQEGTDTIEASFLDDTETRRSATATKTWAAAAEPSPPADPPPADIGLRISGPEVLQVGEEGVFSFEVFNAGPGSAPDAALGVQLPSNLALVRFSTTRGTCAGSGARVDCSFGTLGVDESATVDVVARGESPGTAVVQGVVGSGVPDPNIGDNNTSTVTTQVGAPFQPPTPPPPILGQPTGVPIQGIVLVNGEELLVPRRLGSGDIVDVSRGRIELRSVNGTGQFHSGVFRLIEFPVPNGYTQLHLFGGNFPAVCGHSQRRTSGADGSERHVKKPVRRLWGNARGRFRTKGRYASATVRGTLWLTSDRCDGTLIAVRRGVMSIFDTTKRRTIVVRQFQTYLAPPRGPRPR